MIKHAFVVALVAVVGCGDNSDVDLPPAPTDSALSRAIDVDEDGTITLDASATDPEGEALTFSASSPAHGTLTGEGPSYSYAPDANYHGDDTVLVSISDGPNVVRIEFRIEVASIADAPVAADLTADTNEDQGVAIALSIEDVDSDTFTYEIVAAPEHGVLTGVAPDLTYTPALHYDGADSFTYRASDGEVDSNVATVTITVADVLTCGDGVVEAKEQCDDGNADDTDACLSNCMTATCGDGVTQTGVEACDDGNGVDTDACLSTCAVAACGDGVTQAGVEACDDGNDVDTDGCLSSCALAACGDGVTQAGVEACDDGNDVDTDGCLTTCVLPTCGDGFTRAGVEACDDGNADNTDACLSTCAAATCGDGFTRAGVEQCDDANASNTDACLSTCAAATCGDGFTRTGVEACDDANLDDSDACLSSCAAATCGDGITYAGVEQCDDGNVDSTDACTDTCTAAACGDGFIQPSNNEQCEDGDSDTTDECVLCQAAVCGDGWTQAGVEACDDGNTVDTDFCTGACALAACGDGFVQPGEACDDGNTTPLDGCSAVCDTEPVCGDGDITHTEECDDSNTDDDDGCGHSCLVERCGDELVQFSLGEECDDGNLAAGDGCDAACQAEPFVTTPPVLVSDVLACTTSVANAARKIALDGSGVIYVVMQCGSDAYVSVSTNRGTSFSLPASLSGDLPNAPVTVSQVAITTGAGGIVYAAMILNTGEVYLRISENHGATWSQTAVGTSTSPGSGLSLRAFNDDIYVGFAASGGVGVAHNHARGVGSFELAPVAMSIAYFDVLLDVLTGDVIVAADTPGFHVRVSSDNASTFAAEVNPAGQQYYSDWAAGGGSIFSVGINLGASGSSNQIYVIDAATLTSVGVPGLPVVTTPQSRSVSADSIGNAFVASTLNGGGVQLDRLPAGTTTFDAPRLLDASGSSPISAPLPGDQGAAVVYTVGTQVFATIQTY
jgi:cysteine-rich repeat protein